MPKADAKKAKKPAKSSSKKSKKSVLSCCRAKKPKPGNATNRPPAPKIAARPLRRCAKPAVVLKSIPGKTTTLTKIPKTPQKHMSGRDAEMKLQKPLMKLRSKEALQKSDAAKPSRSILMKPEKSHKVTELVRNPENKEPVFHSESLHVFSVAHEGRVVTRWKYRETTPHDGVPKRPLKSKFAVLLSTKGNNETCEPSEGRSFSKVTNARRSLSEASNTGRNLSEASYYSSCPKKTCVNQGEPGSRASLTHSGVKGRIYHRCSKVKMNQLSISGRPSNRELMSEAYRSSVPSEFSINSFSEEKSAGRRIPRAFQTPKKSGGSSEANVEVSSPGNLAVRERKETAISKRKKPSVDVSEDERKKIDEALLACEKSVHRVGTSLKGLKILAGQQLIPGVDGFQHEIDAMFSDMDRMLEWISLLSEKQI
ncbi:hypothetical protein L596_016578 [Steinernema carpocapsae]|uniref:Uncharacterized protein n=1 Tax=Steinernema carpocapsae TaxID=34508 RepID=A0A4U5NIC8_STECR|nr:hypothetical protein L596_016578 [Steinernema carpocapsae]